MATNTGFNTYCNGEIIELRTQLAKANERVKELELNVKAFKEFIAVARIMFLDLDELEVNTSEYADLLSDLFMLFCGGDEFHKYVKKFAIEQKIDGVQLVIDALAAKGVLDTLIGFVINSVVEQLRKESECE